MQALVDIVGNVVGGVRFLFLLFFITVMGFGLLMTGGTAYVAPKVVESVSERAEKVSDRAIKAAEDAHRNEQLAAEGWGYDRGASDTDSWGESE